jgi:hypothetical protein
MVEWKEGGKKIVTVGYLTSETEKWVILSDTVFMAGSSDISPRVHEMKLIRIPRKDITAITTLVQDRAIYTAPKAA